MIRLGYLAPILLIALPLAACDKDNPFEKALTTLNGGTPVPGGPSPSVAVYVSPTPSVERVEVALETEIVPAECIVPAARFREVWCNPATNNLEPIP
jgi:hypothetical protein